MLSRRAALSLLGAGMAWLLWRRRRSRKSLLELTLGTDSGDITRSTVTRSGKAASSGAELYFEVHGDAGRPRMLILNGSPPADCRRPEIRAVVRELCRHFCVAVFDHRGMGQSTMDADDARYSMAQFADDAAAVLRHIGWETCHVFGVSFGGMVAQELALRYPGVLHGHALVLAGTSSGGAGGSSIPYHKLIRGNVFRFWLTTFRNADTRLQRWYLCWIPVLLSVVTSLRPSALGLDHIDPDRRGPAHACKLRVFDARALHDTAARLPSLRCRALVIGFERDGIAPPDNVRALSRLIPGAELQMFDTGHAGTCNVKFVPPAIVRFTGATAGTAPV